MPCDEIFFIGLDSGGGFKYFFIFTPYLGKIIILTDLVFFNLICLLKTWVVATQILLEFSPRTLGMIPILTIIFFKGVETTN